MSEVWFLTLKTFLNLYVFTPSSEFEQISFTQVAVYRYVICILSVTWRHSFFVDRANVLAEMAHLGEVRSQGFLSVFHREKLRDAGESVRHVMQFILPIHPLSELI